MLHCTLHEDPAHRMSGRLHNDFICTSHLHICTLPATSLQIRCLAALRSDLLVHPNHIFLHMPHMPRRRSVPPGPASTATRSVSSQISAAS